MVNAVTISIYLSTTVGVAFAVYQFYLNSRIKLDEVFESESEGIPLFARGQARIRTLVEIHESIADGAKAFLREEYIICLTFIAIAFAVRFLLLLLYNIMCCMFNNTILI
jgi:Na+/H+-translocating membrane pyrophosphatase